MASDRRRGRPAGLRFILLTGAAILAAASPHPASARQPGPGLSPAGLRIRLDTLLADRDLRRAIAGIMIVRLEDGAVVAEVNSGKLLHPASNMKLLTTAAALALLPPGFTLRTNLWGDASVVDGELRGNLYAAGGGDPLLDTLDVDSLAGMAAAAGIRRITGDLVADLSLFDTLAWGKGWMWDDEPDPDEAYIGPLSFNHASVLVSAAPGSREGGPPSCAVFPAGGYFGLDNRAATVARGEADSLVVSRVRGVDTILLRGTVSLASPPETTALSVRRPELHFLYYLRERLAARGIDLRGTIRAGPATGRLFLGRIERPLGQVLARVNKISDNLAAESLLKILAAVSTGAPGSSEAGLRLVASYLAGLGIDSGSVIAADGSGVSWYDAVTPKDIVSVLRDQYARKGTFGAFYHSLARAGYDGTLSSRLAGTAAAGRVAAKTGSLTGVSTLSGYLTTASNELLAFSIMVNHFPGNIRRLRSLQDAILLDLVRLEPGPRR